MTADLSTLISRLEAADAGSRELDDWVVIAALDGEMMDWWSGEAQQHQIKAGDGSRVNVTPVTTSLDAALALAERVLPGWVYMLVNDYGGYYRAELVRPESSAIQCAAETMPLALCIAILKAKMETEK